MGREDEHHDPTDEARDAMLDERKAAALAVIDACFSVGWFTDAQFESAMETSGCTLSRSFVKLVDKALDEYRDENRGIWPSVPATLRRAFDEYLKHDINAAVRS